MCVWESVEGENQRRVGMQPEVKVHAGGMQVGVKVGGEGGG